MDNSRNIILVTGATGTTGREIVRKLSESGAHVRVLTRDIAKAQALSLDSLPHVTVFEGDLGNSESLAPALFRADKAMLISSSNPEMEDVQINFIETAKKFNLNHIVKLSGIIADINSPFRQVPNIIERDSLFLPMENQRIASIDVYDVAEVAVRILTGMGHKGNVYPVTGTEALTIYEVAEKFSAVLGRKINYVNISPEDANKARRDAGMPEYTVDALDELFAERRKGKESKVYYTMQNVFGLRPTSFDEFIIRNLPVFTGELPVFKM
jgi:uncharacterized protein YbjT (DUF2867 family)